MYAIFDKICEIHMSTMSRICVHHVEMFCNVIRFCPFYVLWLYPDLELHRLCYQRFNTKTIFFLGELCFVPCKQKTYNGTKGKWLYYIVMDVIMWDVLCRCSWLLPTRKMFHAHVEAIYCKYRIIIVAFTRGCIELLLH